MYCVNGESLFCEEEMGGSPWKNDGDSELEPQEMHLDSMVVEDDDFFGVLMMKETSFMPGDEYFSRLQSPGLRGARCRAVRWMLKASGHFSFNPHTISSAVNCFDRFLAANLDKPWKTWMINLLSIGCLSLAAKQDEVHVPLLQDLQVEGVEHTFNSATLQRMELIILNTLGWRLRSVTAFSYTNAVLPQLAIASNIKSSLHARVTELLLQSLPEARFVEYKPSITALSAIYCALEELVPTQASCLKSKIYNIIPADKQKLQRCYEIIEQVLVDPIYTTPSAFSNSKSSPASPVAVTEIADQIGQENDRNVSDYLNSLVIHIKKCGNSD